MSVYFSQFFFSWFIYLFIFSRGVSGHNWWPRDLIKKKWLCISINEHTTFIRRFYPKRLTIAFRLYSFNQYVFPGNRTHNLLRCWRNALPLSHTGTYYFYNNLAVVIFKHTIHYYSMGLNLFEKAELFKATVYAIITLKWCSYKKQIINWALWSVLDSLKSRCPQFTKVSGQKVTALTDYLEHHVPGPKWTRACSQHATQFAHHFLLCQICIISVTSSFPTIILINYKYNWSSMLKVINWLDCAPDLSSHNLCL